MSCSTCQSVRTVLRVSLLMALLLVVSLSLVAAERLPTPASNAASALRSMLMEAARPAASAASATEAAVRGAVKSTPKPADVAASAAQAMIDSMLPAASAVLSVQGAAASSPAVAASSASAPRVALDADPTPAAAACMRTDDRIAACRPDQQLSLSPITLPTARIGTAYKSRRLVSGGAAPYRFLVVAGTKPEGLEFSTDGVLTGKALGTVRVYNFTVQVADASLPSLTTRQAYSIRVEMPPLPRPVPEAASAASQPAPVVQAEVVPRPPQITSYMLLQEDLDDMFPKAKADAAAPPAPAASQLRRRPPRKLDASAPTPFADRMHAMLKPMLNIDFPSVELFESALEARRCAYYAEQLGEASQAVVRAYDLRCPTADGSAPPHPAAAALPAALFAGLLPASVKRDLVQRAEWPHLFSEAQPVEWTDNGCGCVPPTKELVYGLYPFWQARENQRQQIQFNLFNRIGYLGAQLSDTGDIFTAVPLAPEQARFPQAARRFGTQVDLVIQRSSWDGLLNQPDLDVITDRAIYGTMSLVDAAGDDMATRLRRLFLPLWDEPTHLFDGVTLYFDNAPTDPAGREKFRAFYRSFVQKLTLAMQKNGRAYALNIVVPDSELGKEGAYSFEQLMGYLRDAEKPSNPRLPEGAEHDDYFGTTDISVAFIVLLREPTGAAKKSLRARIDETDAIQGHRRVAFLNSVVPVVFHSGAEPEALPTSVDKTRLDLDLAYFKWQYGGAGFWHVPMSSDDNGRAIDVVLAANYGSATPGGFVCNIVCPNRSAVRLVFMLLLVTGITAFSLYFWVCAVRRIGRPYIAFLWLGGVLTLLVGLALLSCDPQLEELRDGTGLLLILLTIAVATGMYYSLRPRITPP